ncbi:MAG: MBL fold metallo-hydrolase, partial [Candidatus Korarchaeota archaeon]|nr:MBL fold metallo-hydrolase [Candidatus Korarchaeota archaeon]
EHRVHDVKVYVVDRSLPGSRGVIASYLMVSPEGEAVLVDPGPRRGYEGLVDAVRSLIGDPERLKAVLLTHIHLDHAGAAGDLAASIRDLRIYVHPRGAPHLADPSRLWESSLEILGETARLYGRPRPIPPDRIIVPRDGEALELSGISISVLYTPGHASHHISYLVGDMLFAGDSAGTFQCGSLFPTTPFPFKLVEAVSSIDRMRDARPRRIAYTHYGVHEPATELLGLYRQLLLDLAELVWSLMQSGVEAELIAARVDEATGMVSRYRECMDALGAYYVRDHIEQSLQGMRRFLERFGPQHRGVQR